MNKNTKLILIADHSGSMGEASKPYIAENLVKFIYESIDIKSTQFNSLSLYLWSDSLQKADYDKSQFSLPECAGKSNIKELISFLKNGYKDTNDRLNVLILTDWSIKRADKKDFQIYLDSEVNISVKIIQIETGKTDLNINQSTIIYHPQNIYGIIQSWI